LERAGQVARRFLQAVVEADVEVTGRRVIRTASIGVCELRPDQSMEDALNVADAALYEAKSKGKNQILAADQDVVLRMRQNSHAPLLRRSERLWKMGKSPILFSQFLIWNRIELKGLRL
jgi:predicted signal transduction protein with EAL and GGDEF domain